MILFRITPSTVLQFYRLSSSVSPKFLSQCPHSYSTFSTSSTSSSSSETKLRQTQARALATTTSVALKKGGGDSFYAEESISWTSLGVSDKLSRALFNAGLGQPSLVQVILYLSLFNYSLALSFTCLFLIPKKKCSLTILVELPYICYCYD